MVRYFYALTPAVSVVGAVVLATTVFFALIAIMVASLVAVVALAWAIVSVSFKLGRAIRRRWQFRSGASPQTAAALSPARRQNA